MKGTDGLAKAQDELALQRSVQHPNVLAAVADPFLYDSKDGRAVKGVLPSELADKELFDLVAEGAVTKKQALVFAEQALDAIGAVHQKGIVHRDIKLENFLVLGGVLKLSDFGLAARVDDKGQCKGFAGTPKYLAPEVARYRDPGALEEEPYSTPADIFSLGVMFLGLFDPDRFSEVMDQQSPVMSLTNERIFPYNEPEVGSIEGLIDRMTRADPAQRPSIQEIRAELQKLKGGA
jgi:serine/threonine protein kinase